MGACPKYDFKTRFSTPSRAAIVAKLDLSLCAGISLILEIFTFSAAIGRNRFHRL